MSDENNQTKPLYIFLIFCLFLNALYLTLFIDSGKYSTLIKNEMKATYKLVGEDFSVQIKERTTTMYTTIVVDSQFQDLILYALLPKNKKESTMTEMVNNSDKYIYRFVNNTRQFIFQTMYRLSALITWVWILIPFILFQLVDGYFCWKQKQYSFGQIEQKKYTLWRRLSKFKAIAICAYIVIPAFYSYSVALLSPVVLILIFLSINRSMRHFQKLAN
jgi:hypothetical protein